MNADAATKQSFIRRNYHWVIAVVVCLSYCIFCGLSNNMYSLYVIPVSEGLGTTRGAFSIAPSIKYLAAFVFNLAFTALFHKFGYRVCVAVTMVLSGLAYVGYATAGTILPFYLGACIVGLAEPFCATAGTTRILNTWFHSHRGLITGVVMASSGISGSVFSVWMTDVMAASDWRAAFWISAILLFIGGVCVFLFVRGFPDEMGLRPMGEQAGTWTGKERSKKRAARHTAWEGLPYPFLKHRRYFLLMPVAIVFLGLPYYGVYSVVVPYVQSRGLTAAEAASIQSVMFAALAVAKILSGVLCDRFGAKLVYTGCLLCTTVSTLLLILVPTYAGAMAAVVILGLALSIPSVPLPMLVSELFGWRSSGTVLGIQLAMMSLSGIASSPMLNVTYDNFGTYVPALWVLLAMTVVSTVLHLIVYRSADKDRAAFEAAQTKKE